MRGGSDISKEESGGMQAVEGGEGSPRMVTNGGN